MERASETPSVNIPGVGKKRGRFAKALASGVIPFGSSTAPSVSGPHKRCWKNVICGWAKGGGMSFRECTALLP
eukprot:1490288-Lingulodinium_polyedra.AAC.1